jgi:hypothetical protein
MPAIRMLPRLGVLAWLLLMADVGGGAEAVVAVQLASGRQFQGEIDVSSTGQALVLRTATDGITLRRPIAWERIISASVDGQPADVMAMREMAARRSQEPGVRGQKSDVSRKIELIGEASAGEAVMPAVVPVEAPRVVSVAFDANIASWDSDVETDGVAILVAPLDVHGYLVAAGGTVEVELLAPQRRTLDLAPLSGGDTLELVERWTRAIAPEDFGPSGVRLRLPFGAITPELQPDWLASSYGLVHVRLVIPGQGVFEASRDGVRVRPWAPNRDRLEMKTGQRFLPTENLGRRD